MTATGEQGSSIATAAAQDEGRGDQASGAADGRRQAFRFLDNREKYLLFVTTCSEKWEVAERVGLELSQVEPRPPALRVFDAGMGDSTVLCHVLRQMHRLFPHIPWLVVGKEISLEDIRLSLEKFADRFAEHPHMVLLFTNMYYSEAPWLVSHAAAEVNWLEVPLEGSSSYEFQDQIRGLFPRLVEGWQVRTSEKSGNPLYVKPSVLMLYRRDQSFVLDSVLPHGRRLAGGYDLIVASQPYRARTPAEVKVKLVIAPLARALAPGGRMIVVQAHGGDPGLEIIQQVWPGEDPFRTRRHALLKEAQRQLSAPEERDLRYIAYPDHRALFRYQLHTLPSEVAASIGTSTLMAAWNAAVYVAQIEDRRLSEALADGGYLEATRAVLRKHNGLWFQDESFVIAREPRS